VIASVSISEIVNGDVQTLLLLSETFGGRVVASLPGLCTRGGSGFRYRTVERELEGDECSFVSRFPSQIRNRFVESDSPDSFCLRVETSGLLEAMAELLSLGAVCVSREDEISKMFSERNGAAAAEKIVP
jgi:hypothetical protein